MKYFAWDDAKNAKLRGGRGVGLEDIAELRSPTDVAMRVAAMTEIKVSTIGSRAATKLEEGAAGICLSTAMEVRRQ